VEQWSVLPCIEWVALAGLLFWRWFVWSSRSVGIWLPYFFVAAIMVVASEKGGCSSCRSWLRHGKE
jgi:hypothetical protein